MATLPGGIARGGVLRNLLSKALSSGKMRAGAAFLIGAVAFALANLLLAGHLVPSAYGTLALIVAIIAAGTPIAPFGLALLVVRRHLPVEPHLLTRCAFTSALVALGAAAIAAAVYRLAPAALLIIAISIVGGGFTRLASARLQSEERFLASTFVSESMNYMLLAAAAGTLLMEVENPLWPLAFVCMTQVALAGVLLYRLLVGTSPDTRREPARFRLSEMLLLTGTNAATMLLLQIERFAIPLLLDIETLAAFAVLAVLAIAPFRPVEVGTYRTLLPRLRRSTISSERRQLLIRESRQTVLVLVGFGVVIALATPVILKMLFAGKYELSFGTILAGIAAGQLRVVRSVSSATILALADQRGLVFWNLIAWLSVLTAFLGGWAGSPWGLQGFLWGVALGGSFDVLLALPLVFRCLR
jgi:O-antigen/teichoic acid export membrane protein